MENRYYYCYHCCKKVSKTQYYQHKRLYYSKENQTWITSNTCVEEAVDPDSDFHFSAYQDDKDQEDEQMECGQEEEYIEPYREESTDEDFDLLQVGKYKCTHTLTRTLTQTHSQAHMLRAITVEAQFSNIFLMVFFLNFSCL